MRWGLFSFNPNARKARVCSPPPFTPGLTSDALEGEDAIGLLFGEERVLIGIDGVSLHPGTRSSRRLSFIPSKKPLSARPKPSQHFMHLACVTILNQPTPPSYRPQAPLAPSLCPPSSALQAREPFPSPLSKCLPDSPSVRSDSHA